MIIVATVTQRFDDFLILFFVVSSTRNAKTFDAGLKNPFRFLYPVHKMTSNYKKVKNAQEFLTNFFSEIRLDNAEESLLECLLKSEAQQFTRKQICEHILTYLNAGLDTTAAHLNYTLLFLAMHPSFQEKLFEEVKNVEATDFETILKLDYLDRVSKESFRLAPPIFLIGRETIEDFEISPGVVIPKDTSLAINTFVLHRRRDIYGENSEKFDPDHFLQENVAKRHPFSFQPFSTGRRNCIGVKFATVFLKLMLAALVRNFSFKTESSFEGLQFKYGMTLKFTKQHLMMIVKRK